MKPSWADAPEWAQWLAMDEDGCWNWYETKPEICDGGFASTFWPQSNFLSAGYTKIDGWEDTLEQRP